MLKRHSRWKRLVGQVVFFCCREGSCYELGDARHHFYAGHQKLGRRFHARLIGVEEAGLWVQPQRPDENVDEDEYVTFIAFGQVLSVCAPMWKTHEIEAQP